MASVVTGDKAKFVQVMTIERHNLRNTTRYLYSIELKPSRVIHNACQQHVVEIALPEMDSQTWSRGNGQMEWRRDRCDWSVLLVNTILYKMNLPYGTMPFYLSKGEPI